MAELKKKFTFIQMTYLEQVSAPVILLIARAAEPWYRPIPHLCGEPEDTYIENV